MQRRITISVSNNSDAEIYSALISPPDNRTKLTALGRFWKAAFNSRGTPSELSLML